jgi:phosphate starvation-inducible PhoH-like protein
MILQGGFNLSRAKNAKAQRRFADQSVLQKENTIDFNSQRYRKINIVPRSRGQEALVLALQNANTAVVVTAGPAGTGKTYLAMLAAIQALRSGECERIILTRPAVGVDDERHGFLPGDLVSKMEPWTRPLLDVMREYYHPRDILRMIDDQIVEIAPLAYMRGRTFKQAWIIADEMQNATPAQIKMLLTRIGEGSKIVVTGDVDQTDRAKRDNGLLDLVTRLQAQPVNGLEVCSLNVKDVQRHPLIGPVLKLYQDLK